MESPPVDPSQNPDQALAFFTAKFEQLRAAHAEEADRLYTPRGALRDRGALQRSLTLRNGALAEYGTQVLLPHTAALLAQARARLDELPTARHHAGLRLVLDDLDYAADQIQKLLSLPGNDESAEQRDRALWPYLETWGERSMLLRELIHHPAPQPFPQLPPEQEQQLTEWARGARMRGNLSPYMSWYDASGTQITLTYQEGTEYIPTCLALAGDIDGPDMRVIGAYGSDDQALAELPPPVSPGTLRRGRPEVVRSPAPPEAELRNLVRDVVNAQSSSELAEAIHIATARDPAPSAAAEFSTFLATCAEWAEALDTRAGSQAAGRLRLLTHQFSQVVRELNAVSEDLESTVSLLPPHRTPLPRHLPSPKPALSIRITDPPVAAPATVPAARRR
ncbi:hypothetical protein [Streptomyces sp. NPDC051561]|uniref:hypothetical protein n=1 Tax=Streptomyces sp. NPDC051561 TaxID=3365658 RepID=UPI0037A0EB80